MDSSANVTASVNRPGSRADSVISGGSFGYKVKEPSKGKNLMLILDILAKMKRLRENYKKLLEMQLRNKCSS